MITKRQFERALEVFLIVAGMIFICAVEAHWIFAVLAIACFAGAAALDKG